MILRRVADIAGRLALRLLAVLVVLVPLTTLAGPGDDGPLTIDAGTQSAAGDPGPEAALWQNLRSSSKDPTDFATFLRLFPGSRYAGEARRRLMELTDGANAGKPQSKAGPAPANNTQAGAAQNLPPAAPAVAYPPMVAASNVPLAPRRGQIGNRFQDCPSCPQMVRIPGGSFMMGLGSHEEESEPAHHVDVRAFAIGEAPVTVGEWKVCMAAKVCSFLPRMRDAEDRTPVHNLSWDDASQYLTWLSDASGHIYRLPSEAEWEYAARGGTTTRYWWGESVGMSLANCADCGGTQDTSGPMSVDALSPNPYGLLDILGGVAQWTADCWFPNYRGAPADATPRQSDACEKRVLRGGSFRSPHDQITVTYRVNYDASVRYLVNGFRVARDLE